MPVRAELSGVTLILSPTRYDTNKYAHVMPVGENSKEFEHLLRIGESFLSYSQ